MLIYTGCDNININCSRGTHCKVDETVHQAYCEASCDLNNGGCADDEVCSLLQPVTCEDVPCPSDVQCTCELYMYTTHVQFVYYCMIYMMISGVHTVCT